MNIVNTLYELAAFSAAESAKLCNSAAELLNPNMTCTNGINIAQIVEDVVTNDIFGEESIADELRRIRTPIDRKGRFNSVTEMLSFPNQEFRRHFRLDRSTFQVLCEQLAPLIYPEVSIDMPATDWVFTNNCITLSVAVSLYILGHRASFTVVSAVFGIGRSTAYAFFAKFLNAMKGRFGDSLNQPLTSAQVEKYAEDCSTAFREKGAVWCPKIIGAVDGSHIYINAPSEGPEGYYNRKQRYSVILQAVASPSCEILHAVFGFAGRVHDATVYKNSGVSQWLPPSATLLGDSAYPFSQQLITPFRDDGTLDRSKKHYNGMISCKRSCVERTFGQLKGRWTIMFHIPYRDMNTVNLVILVCCLLHNICVGHLDLFDFDDTPAEIVEQGYNEDVPVETPAEDRTVTAKRLTLMKKILGGK
ncbi:uncharacterized protein LOC129590073 [Paramacrobiotus metropolitanus]|uniref:uncharacterized protein LOC129590073 n=1 Tax=Paramacrobiotus metropolitanus TaxID=2943436 RepID=UPI0024460456|nr:uncharacterized protein LOC129590073 [Paramacrobiotus metropolitanus]